MIPFYKSVENGNLICNEKKANECLLGDGEWGQVEQKDN